MNKAFLLLLLPALVFASQAPPAQISEAMGEVQDTSQALLAVGIVLSIMMALPLIAIGLFLFLKKKKDKKLKILGIVLIIAGIFLPIFLVVLYLIIPPLISAMMA